LVSAVAMAPPERSTLWRQRQFGKRPFDGHNLGPELLHPSLSTGPSQFQVDPCPYVSVSESPPSRGRFYVRMLRLVFDVYQRRCEL
jgi:hypothetical protein